MGDRALNLQKVRSQFDRAFSQMPSQISEGSDGKTSEDPPPKDLVGSSNLAQSDGSLKWGQESKEKQAKFKQVVLPPGFAEDPTNQPAGQSPRKRPPRQVRPSENVAAEVSQEFQTTTSGEIRTRELRPRHRAVVDKYFQADSNAISSPTNPPSAGE
jgi:hypothetical protein